MTANELRSIARRVRRFLERQHPENTTLLNLCERASYILYTELEHRGAYMVVNGSWTHVVLYCSGYYVDVTATQFGAYPRVMVRRKMPNHYHWLGLRRYSTSFHATHPPIQSLLQRWREDQYT